LSVFDIHNVQCGWGIDDGGMRWEMQYLALLSPISRGSDWLGQKCRRLL